MLNFKRSLLMIVGLLCVLCFVACGGAAKPTNGVASQGDTNNSAATAAVVPTAQPQKTAEAIKVQSQNTQQKTQSSQNDTQAQNQAARNGDQQQGGQNNAGTMKTAQSSAQSSTQAGDQSMQNDAQNNNANSAPPAGGSGTVVASTQVSVNGQMQTVLTTGTGMTLYYRTSDPAPGSTCTGACAQAWPPFIAQGNLIPSGSFQGQLTVHMTANGNQVEYNGHPLYTYNGDKIHELNGQGLDGVWDAVTVLPQKQHW